MENVLLIKEKRHRKELMLISVGDHSLLESLIVLDFCFTISEALQTKPIKIVDMFLAIWETQFDI